MCEKHYYKFTTRDGMVEKKSQTDHCSQARRRGVVCAEPQKFKHPDGERPPPKSTPQYLSANNFPPSPPSSDTSFAPSGSDGERTNKRRSGVYVNGQRVAEVGVSRKPSQRERRGSAHVVIVEPPASPRTPPRYVTPVGSPSRSPSYSHEPRSHQYPSYTHPEVRVEVNRPRPESTPHYSYVPSSPRARRDSHSQGSSSVSDEEARIRRLKRELKEAQKQAEESTRRAAKAEEVQKDATRKRKVEFDIKRQNEDIASRPAVPAAPSPLKKPSAPASNYRRPSVSIQQTDMLSDAMRNVRLEPEGERRRREKRAQELRDQQARDDEAAQRDRLRARMAPQRSNTTGHGNVRRPTVVYDEYR